MNPSSLREKEHAMCKIYGIDNSGLDYCKAAAKIARQVAGPPAAAVDAAAQFPEKTMSELGREGFFGLCIPTEFQGKGQGPRAFAAVVEALAESCPSSAMIFVMHTAAAQAVIASTRLAVRDQILRDMAAGNHLTTVVL